MRKNRLAHWHQVLAIMLITPGLFAQPYQQGIKALEYENFHSAYRLFRQQVQAQPSDPMASYYLGLTLCYLGKPDSAIAVFTHGLSLDAKNYYNYIGLGRAYLEKNQPAKANEYFEKARSLTSAKDQNYYLAVAEACIRAEHPDYARAVSLLNRVIELNNRNAEAYWLLGLAYEGMGVSRTGDAVSAYERATELNPSLAKAYTRMGRIWRDAQRGELSKTNFDKAIAADPHYPPAYRERAELFYMIGQTEKAVQDYHQYLKLADESDETRFRYAQFLFLTKKYNEVADILASLWGKIDKPIYFRLMAYTAYETGKYEEGLRHLEEYFRRIDPNKIIAADYEYQTRLNLALGRAEEAKKAAFAAVAMDSSKADLYGDLAKWEYDRKNFPEAARFYAMKIAVAPRKAQIVDYFNLGRSHYQAANYAAADSAFATVIRLNPNWAVGYLWRGRSQQGLDHTHLDSVRGLAVPYYLMVLEKASSDATRFSRELVEAYEYLGNINLIRNHYGTATYYYQQALALNPGNEAIKQTMSAIKERYKPVPPASMPLTAHTEGLQAEMIINGVKQLYPLSALVLGVSVNQEGSALLGWSPAESQGKVTVVKVGERSLSQVPVSINENQKQPVLVGVDVLNRMNIVIDFANNQLLFR
ncbi:MAG: tetratricopeptide repeat protein [Chitinophagales bacterium]|nr:tetratricopeptide repeat protein [Chitinophagales bacterium]MDW8428397.1 CDC27 family protein [Chitinophagales bacterium]